MADRLRLTDVWNAVSQRINPLDKSETVVDSEKKEGFSADYSNALGNRSFYDKEAVAQVAKDTIRAAGIGFQAGSEYIHDYVESHNVPDAVKNVSKVVTKTDDWMKNSELGKTFGNVVKQAKQNMTTTYNQIVPEQTQGAIKDAAAKVSAIGRSTVDSFKSGMSEYKSRSKSDDGLSL